MNVYFEINKSYTENGTKYLSGCISSTKRDLQGDTFSIDCLKAMQKTAIGVPLATTHDRNPLGLDDIGELHKSWIQDDHLFAEFKLNDDPRATALFKAVQKGTRAGFSVGGRAKVDSSKSYSFGSRFIDFQWDHVIPTVMPVNDDTLNYTHAIAKSTEELTKDAELHIIQIEDINDEQMVDVAKKVNPSDEQREEHASYFEEEDGKKVGKFPVWNKESAQSAAHLIGKAPAQHRAAVIAKICKFDPESSLCGSEKDTKKAMDTVEVEKAGAKFSEDTMAQLKAMHSIAPPDLQDMIKNMVGEDTAAMWSASSTAEDAEEDMNGAPDQDVVGDSVAVMNAEPGMDEEVNTEDAPSDEAGATDTIDVVMKEQAKEIADLRATLAEVKKAAQEQIDELRKPKAPVVVEKAVKRTIPASYGYEQDIAKSLANKIMGSK